MTGQSLSNNSAGSMLNEFTFAARIASVFSGFRPLLLRFSFADDLQGEIKFDPRFYLLSSQHGNSLSVPLRFSHAWAAPFGVFLFLAKPSTVPIRVLFVSSSSPQIAMLRTLLNRLQVEETVEKPSLSTYFWRMNVLR